MFFVNRKNSVPVIMYHSVGVPQKSWIWNHLTVDYRIFDKQMATLKAMGYNTISLNDLYQYVDKGKNISKKSFVLTFDDGYADNWIAVSPILKKYGFKGTVYVNPEFVDPRRKCRKTLSDVWNGYVNEKEIEWDGFLSWPEMIELENDGVLDIQSHSMSHTWFFCSPRVIDFRHPGDEYVWMNWNDCPENKYKYISDGHDSLNDLGSPVYENGKALQVKRYFPNENIKNELVDHVKSLGGSEFFKRDDWKKYLLEIYNDLIDKYGQGHYETEEEFDSRIKYELEGSRNLLEKKLGKNVEFLCWPGGGYNELTVIKAKNVYKSMTLATVDQQNKKNINGEDPSTIKRIGIPYVLKGDDWNGIRYLGGYSLYLSLCAFKGSLFCKVQKKIIRLLYLFLVRANLI